MSQDNVEDMSFLTHEGVEKDLYQGSPCCAAKDAFGDPMPCIRRVHVGSVLKLRQALWLRDDGSLRERKKVTIR